MAIIRWEPFREMTAPTDPFSRVFGDMFSRFLEPGERGMRVWAPAVDIYETGKDVVVKAEVPGLDPKDVEVRVEDGTLYLKGERKFESEVKEENYYRVERCYGSFARSFPLPASVNADKATAEYANGVLTLTLPKREESQAKTIKIVSH